MKKMLCWLVNVTDAPRVTVDKLYLSHHSQLTLELVCSAQANPTASITWSRMEPDTGAWVQLIEDPTETGVWTVDRQVWPDDKLMLPLIQIVVSLWWLTSTVNLKKNALKIVQYYFNNDLIFQK